LPALALLWFAATCAPALAAALLGVAETAVAERFLYLPSVAVAMAAGALVAAGAGAGQRRAAAVAAALLVVALGVATFQRSLAWRDNLALWSDAVAKAPAEGLPLNELAVATAVAGDVERAFALWEEAQGLRNSGENAATIDANLGNYWLRKRDWPRARAHLEAAVGRHPALPNAQQGLGRVLAVQAAALPPTPEGTAAARELLGRSRAHYAAAVAALPAAAAPRIEFADMLVLLADVAYRDGDAPAAGEALAAARGELERALELEPAAASRPGVQRLLSRTTPR
jgi:tetratricopeptide (TPR) repeat protein